MSDREYPPPPKAAESFAEHLQAHGWDIHTGDSHGSAGFVRDVFWHRVWGVRGDLRLQAEWQVNRPSVYDEGWTPTKTVGRWSRSGTLVFLRDPDFPVEWFVKSQHLGSRKVDGRKVDNRYVRVSSVSGLHTLAEWDDERITEWVEKHQ